MPFQSAGVSTADGEAVEYATLAAFPVGGVSTADGEAVEYATLAACELEGDTLPFSESELADL